jgi:superfamily II DNA or RNA helicase
VAQLEDLTRGAAIRGILPDGLVTVVDVHWYGTSAIELTYKDAAGRPGNQLLYRDDEARLEVVSAGRPWSFDADGGLLRLVSEAQRIRLAYLFDPFLAVHTSLIEPLPHQITAVYGTMLPRQPLRFLLADDPGAGKTIMAGLFIKELFIRGDLCRCLIVCPANLAEQWQDELYQRFHLPFEILTNDRIEAARSGNIFTEMPLLIARLDKLARDEELQAKLALTDWDLIVCDEAHKMSAAYFGGEISYTKRYRLGQMLGGLARHFLLMTATPHNGKEEDFQLFMALLDADRFEGRFRDGVHTVDVSDLLRRLPKEQLLKFDGRPLFPERLAYTVPYPLSDLEARLYHDVTEYVREEFNRADALESEGRKGTVGFALTILQRRLASSPEAIYQSLKRRRERLERRLRAAELVGRGAAVSPPELDIVLPEDPEALDEAPAEELEALEEELVDQATASRTVAELRIEIGILQRLEALALQVRRSGTDRKWEELSSLLQDQAQMFAPVGPDAGPAERDLRGDGSRRKLIVFTEHRDTLTYLADRIRTLLGRPEAVVIIHGGLGREERRKAQETFTQDKDVQILIATDAAGEGINLQRAHLMINYDLSWNPNRIEQRFGRIHRIGQTEVCHLWNLLAQETREGDVYQTLLRKLEQERQALGGAVFDVLGLALDGAQLRKLMIEAIRYGDRPDVRARLTQAVEVALDTERLRSLLRERALAQDVMSPALVEQVRLEMERLEARRLQPHFIAAFFKAAFEHLGGTLREREMGRYEITHVPAMLRQRDRVTPALAPERSTGASVGAREPVLARYERITFEKSLIAVPGKPVAAFICPGHPLLDATTDLVLERYRDLMKQGAVLVDESDPGEELRALFYLEHSVQDARPPSPALPPLAGEGSYARHVVSRRLQFVECSLQPPDSSLQAVIPAKASSPMRNGFEPSGGRFHDAGPAPYLDYQPMQPEEQALVATLVERALSTQELEAEAIGYAIQELVPRHLEEVRRARETLIAKTTAAVKDRLTKEIAYWDHRAEDLKAQELAGKVNAKINSGKARQRADDLEARLRKRLAELEQERQIAALPPVAIGGALVVPGGLLARLRGQRRSAPDLFARETKRVEEAAMAAVMAAERALDHFPVDVSDQNRGYDIESLISGPRADDDRLRFIEVKGRITGAETVTISKNEILTFFNTPDDWVLALVEVPPAEGFPEGDAFAVRDEREIYGAPASCVVRYVQHPFVREPDFGATSVNYDWGRLWASGGEPC